MRRLLAVSLCLTTATLIACGGGDAPPAQTADVAPTITRQPASITVPAGQTASFTVDATGSNTLSYQWMLNGTAIQGATQTSYITPALALSASGNVYSVSVGDQAGKVTSLGAVVTVANSATATLAASVRLLTATEESEIVSSTELQVTFSSPIDISPGTTVLGTTHAFKVVSAASSATQTMLTVTEPTLSDLFSSFIIHGNYVATPAMAVPASAGRVALHAAPMARDAANATATFSWPYTLSDGGFSVNATLSSTISASVDYEYQNGSLQQATLDVSTDNELDLSESFSADATTSFEQTLGQVIIPIDVSVLDAALSAVGVRLVSIVIPVYAGATLNSTFQAITSQAITVDGGIHLSYSSSEGPTAATSFMAQFVPNPLNPASPSGEPAFATLSEHGSVYVRMAPALSFVDSIALLGVDTKLSLDDAAQLQIVASTPPYCLTNSIGLNVSADGFFKAAGIAPFKTSVYEANLYQGAPYYVGSCQSPVMVQASAANTPPIPYGTPVAVTATVAPTSPSFSLSPSGIVTITAQGAACQASLSSSSAGSATGTCSLTPLTSGSAAALTVSYSGDSTFAPGVGQFSVAIAGPPYTLLGSPVTLVEEEPLGTPLTQSVTTLVGPGVEFSSGNLVDISGSGIIGSTLNVGATYIDIVYNVSETAAFDSFNGPVFTFGSGSPSILGCSLDPLSTYTATQVQISCNGTQVLVNASGITTSSTSRILIDLQLGQPVQ